MDLDSLYYPKAFVVPNIEIIHDRTVEEIFSGMYPGMPVLPGWLSLSSGAGKSPETIDRQSRELCRNTGYDEISLSSLSSSDYTRITELLEKNAHVDRPGKGQRVPAVAAGGWLFQ